MFLFPVNKRKLVVSLIIGIVCFVGDKNTENQSDHVVTAICDNVTHALVGALTWIGIFAAKTAKPDIYFAIEIIICATCSSLIDVDHFIAAKSLNLKDATKLKTRPFLHSTTLAVFVVTSILLVSYLFKINWLTKLGWILTTAFLSHHIRDSKRRGFWLWPLGSTVPTPFLTYYVAQMFLPQLLSVIISEFFPLPTQRGESIPALETV